MMTLRQFSAEPSTIPTIASWYIADLSKAQGNQELIDQFNHDEQLWRRLQWRKVKRRVRFPKLAASSHAILDLLDEMRERRKPADCVSR
ncbi:MAG: hypothetical protein ISR62_05355 [Desulfobacteraceae bacterium]|nr:hypothetical protein [Desulfobacterales bacterium]MBL6967830.1 hypothetical protein [Desulfobacteraceae bacterium]MBU0732550.1 hypothetical protein [Pseudomonadota bacterium]